MMKTVEFHFDFGSPNAYFTHKLVPGIEHRTGATFTYVPVLLGGVFKLTNNQAPMVAFSGVKNKLAYQHLEIERFIRRYQLTKFRMNPHFPVNTLLTMRGAVAADIAGVLPAYADAVFRAMWEDEKNMADPETAAAVLTEAGLDGPALLARTQDQDVKDKLAANTAMSVDRGAFGSPTFFVGADMYFGKDRIVEVEEAIAA
jgi:2-hydroxychromene-2-carboxylate isomerase